MAAEPSPKSRAKLRRFLWPEYPAEGAWSRTHGGWVAVPRTLPLILEILNHLSPGKPLASTYVELNCRDFGDHLVILSKAREMSYFAGFRGNRAESTWIARLRKLEALGFVKLKSGPAGSESYALILDPHRAIDQLAQHGRVPEDLLLALRQRAIEVGADDVLTPSATTLSTNALTSEFDDLVVQNGGPSVQSSTVGNSAPKSTGA